MTPYTTAIERPLRGRVRRLLSSIHASNGHRLRTALEKILTSLERVLRNLVAIAERWH
jgi:hypothetical protein